MPRLARNWTQWAFAFCVLMSPLPALCWSGYNNVTLTVLTLYQGGQSVWPTTNPPGALIQVSPITPSDTEGCTHSGQGYIWLDWSGTTQPDGKALYASLLAAQIAGKTVSIGVNGCSTAGYPVVYGINVFQ